MADGAKHHNLHAENEYSARISGVQSAGLWSGTAASWVNLNSDGASDSLVYAVSGEQQAGWRRSPWVLVERDGGLVGGPEHVLASRVLKQ